jgi:transcription elongation factor Elf1
MNNDYVGVIGVKCGCIFCRECAVVRQILYFGDRTISKKQARAGKLRCSACGERLAEPIRRESKNIKK